MNQFLWTQWILIANYIIINNSNKNNTLGDFKIKIYS